MGNTFWIILTLITEVILFLYAYNVFKGDFVSPSIMTLMMFIISTSCCLYNIEDWKNVIFTGKAYALFSLSFIVMIITERVCQKYKLVFKKKRVHQLNNLEEKTEIGIKKPWDTLLLAFFILCAFLYIYRVYRSGVNLGATGLLNAIGANKEEGDYDSFARLLFNVIRMSSYVYVVILANNIMVCKQKIGKNLSSVLIILLTVIIAFFSGQRGVAIGYVVCVVASFFITSNIANRVEKNVNIKRIVRNAVFITIAIVIVFYLSHSIVKNRENQTDFLEYIAYYFGGATALMGNIVENPAICHEPFVGYFGEKTFMGFWSTLHSWGVVLEAPAERRWIRMGSSVANRAGNEFTFLCGPYIDFGFIGTLIFIVLFYTFFSLLYYKKILRTTNGRKQYTNLAIYLYLYGMVSLSFYQDSIRSYVRPINILYILFIYIFCVLFLDIKKVKKDN